MKVFLCSNVVWKRNYIEMTKEKEGQMSSINLPTTQLQGTLLSLCNNATLWWKFLLFWVFLFRRKNRLMCRTKWNLFQCTIQWRSWRSYANSGKQFKEYTICKHIKKPHWKTSIHNLFKKKYVKVSDHKMLEFFPNT